MKIHFVLTAMLGLGCALLNAADSATTAKRLNVGDPAPELKASKWFKGEAISKLEKGQVYVVEFWATWCGPCKVSIPHLTEVTKKHKGQARVIGMSVWERPKEESERFSLIEKFVAEMGDKMDYHIGADTPDTHMARAWMTAAGENGIPSAFIVDKTGKIAWIGHPMSGLDEALEQVIAGKWDVTAAAAKREKAKAAQEQERELMQKLSALRKEKKFAEALAELDKAIAENAELGKRMETSRLSLLFEVDEAGAVKQVKQMAEGESKNNPQRLYTLVNLLIQPTRKAPDFALALELAERAYQNAKDSQPVYYSLIADVHFAKKDYAKAVEVQEQAMKLLEKDEKMAKTYQSYMTTKLERFKREAQKGK